MAGRRPRTRKPRAQPWVGCANMISQAQRAVTLARVTARWACEELLRAMDPRAAPWATELQAFGPEPVRKARGGIAPKRLNDPAHRDVSRSKVARISRLTSSPVAFS